MNQPTEKLSRVLIVEDDERLASLTQEYLIRNGLEVGIEMDGNRAIRRIIEDQPDIVVLDLMLPGADGLSVCREVRAQGFQQPILMLTARTEDLDQVLGLEMTASSGWKWARMITLPSQCSLACCWHVFER